MSGTPEAPAGTTAGIMQPYLFPYIGYYQLMAAVDCFVILDDVHYIMRGWINRNRILCGGRDKYFTLPLEGASLNRLISELSLHEPEKGKRQILNQIGAYYRKAPYYQEVHPLLEEIILHPGDRLVPYLTHSLRRMAAHLGLRARILLSSELPKDPALTGQDRILDICRVVGAKRYINPVGGMELYDARAFARQSVTLHFLRSVARPYPQSGGDFVPYLSIIDLLMFNSLEEVRGDLDRFEWINPAVENP